VILLILEIALLSLLQYESDAIPEPYFSVMKEVCVHLIAAGITAMFLVVILIYLLPIEEKLKFVEVLEPSRTKALHDNALANTDFWFHHGHIGRWVRTTAMPALAKASVERGITTSVKLILLNPKNESLCKLYAEYRNRIAFRENRINTIEDVQAEILATIIIGHRYDQSPEGIGVHIFLEDHLSLIREDISAIAAFRTQVDPRCPAIIYRNISRDHETPEFYNTAKTEFDFVARCCIQLHRTENFPDGSITTDKIRAFLLKTGLLLRDDPVFLKSVQSRLQSDFHPYN
jgi:hypothetical protein